MYVEHPGYKLTADGEAAIWRYVDLAKFLDLLETHALWFARLDQMEDLFEGYLPGSQVELLTRIVEAIAETNPSVREKIGNARDKFQNEYAQRTRSSAYINCWHLNDYESGAMWKIYGDDALAIRSTVGALKECFRTLETPDVHIGMVQYVAFESTALATPFEGTALFKRKMYEFEREVRAVILDLDQQIPTDRPGLGHRVDVSTLIQQVYVGPGRAGWYVRLIKSLLERYELPDVPVTRSAMDGKPMTLA